MRTRTRGYFPAPATEPCDFVERQRRQAKKIERSASAVEKSYALVRESRALLGRIEASKPVAALPMKSVPDPDFADGISSDCGQELNRSMAGEV